MKRYYIVTSKPGMVPFSSVSSKREAARDSRAAQKLGLDGRIRAYTDTPRKRQEAVVPPDIADMEGAFQ